jgi:ankyrin repeat protein
MQPSSTTLVTPIQLEKACKLGNLDLIKNAPDTVKWNRKNAENKTYIDISIEHKQYDVIKELIKRGCHYKSIDHPELNHILIDKGYVINNEVSPKERKKIYDISYQLMINPKTTVEDIKQHLKKYVHITTLKDECNIVNELLHLYSGCFSSDRKYEEINYNSWKSWQNERKQIEFKHDLEIVKYLVCDCNADINSIRRESTPVINIVRKWCRSPNEDVSKQILDFLLEKGANINQSFLSASVIYEVLNSNSTDIVNKLNYLISKGAKPQSCTINIEELAFNPVAVQWCVENNLYTPEKGTKMLLKVCKYSSLNSYLYLTNNCSFSKDIKSNNFDYTGHSLLHEVCYSYNYDDKALSMIDDLVNNRGLWIEVQDNENHTCLYYAVLQQNLSIVQHLLNMYSMKVSKEDIFAAVCPHLVNSENKLTIYQLLIKKYKEVHPESIGLDVIKKYYEKQQLYFNNNHHDTSILVECCNDLNDKDYEEAFEIFCKDGMSKLAKQIDDIKTITKVRSGLLSQVCSLDKYLDHTIIELLLTKGADPNEKIDRSMPLHKLCKNKKASLSCFTSLINYGADVDAVDDDKHTPLYYAKLYYTKTGYYVYNHIIKLLIREGAINNEDEENSNSEEDVN